MVLLKRAKNCASGHAGPTENNCLHVGFILAESLTGLRGNRPGSLALLAAYHTSNSFRSTVSLIISHRKLWHIFRNFLASLCLKTTTLSGWNATTKSPPSRLIDTCLRKGRAFFRKDSTTSSTDIYATDMPTKPNEGTVAAVKPIGQLMRVSVRAGRQEVAGHRGVQSQGPSRLGRATRTTHARSACSALRAGVA